MNIDDVLIGRQHQSLTWDTGNLVGPGVGAVANFHGSDLLNVHNFHGLYRVRHMPPQTGILDSLVCAKTQFHGLLALFNNIKPRRQPEPNQDDGDRPNGFGAEGRQFTSSLPAGAAAKQAAKFFLKIPNDLIEIRWPILAVPLTPGIPIIGSRLIPRHV